jgi:hypothetical protein
MPLQLYRGLNSNQIPMHHAMRSSHKIPTVLCTKHETNWPSETFPNASILVKLGSWARIDHCDWLRPYKQG